MIFDISETSPLNTSSFPAHGCVVFFTLPNWGLRTTFGGAFDAFDWNRPGFVPRNFDCQADSSFTWCSSSVLNVCFVQFVLFVLIPLKYHTPFEVLCWIMYRSISINVHKQRKPYVSLDFFSIFMNLAVNRRLVAGVNLLLSGEMSRWIIATSHASSRWVGVPLQ